MPPNATPEKLIVYYDGACPVCVRDKQHYEQLSSELADQVCWYDITGNEDSLRAAGIDPQKALSELHVMDNDGRIVSELDAYVLLMQKVPVLKPLAWLIGLPVIRPFLAKIYHYTVNRRLRKRGLV
jgi:predicted DCC family thiol-disulfide oxidoreductase YuxK